jgi:DNA/RNA endonuclease YhcR with UshA esterase domain
MRYLLTTCCILFFTVSHSQTKVDVNDVNKHTGETVIVCSKVFGVKTLDKVSFLNLGANYPDSPLTIVIFAANRKNFKDSIETLYNGKEVCVTGKVVNYKGKAEIIISKPEEIQLIKQ